jgi:hypothetical protein
MECSFVGVIGIYWELLKSGLLWSCNFIEYAFFSSMDVLALSPRN